MTAHLHIDFETRSTLDLPKVGIHNYATHPTTDAWCMAWALGDLAPKVLGTGLLAKSVREHVEAGRLVVAHNAQFEYMVWNSIMVPRYGWPELKLSQLRCTMAQAYSMSLPGALDNLAVALGLPYRKDNEGYRLMLQMCRPRSVADDGAITWWDDPEKIARLHAYCLQDVVVEREAEKHMVCLSEAEQKLWVLDQQINMRGIHFDRPAVTAAKAMADSEKARLDKEMQKLTSNYVGTCNSHAALCEWIQLHGVKIDGVAKPEVLDALSGELPASVRAALLLRQEAAKSSTAKLKSMLTAASPDDRIRFMLQYHGAGTGRWSGRRVQLHNMPRPILEQADIDACIPLIENGCRDEIDMLYGTPLNVIASCLRGMLDAAPGKDLMAADFANIEGRVLAWLAGEEWKLQAFRDYDAGTGPDIYKLTYVRSFNVPVESVTKDDRQVGKVEELAFGFQGWVGACQTMAKTLNVTVDDNDAEQWAKAWRAAHPRIRAYWGELESAAMDTVRTGATCVVGPVGRQCAFRRVGEFLWLRLPSGRVLCYPYPEVILKTRVFDDGGTSTKEAVTYVGEDSVTHKWGPVDCYGGKWAENITQAVARDILAEAMTRVTEMGASIVLHVHDEIVIEIAETNYPGQLKEFEHAVAESPTWAVGLPIAAAGWRGKRYRK